MHGPRWSDPYQELIREFQALQNRCLLLEDENAALRAGAKQFAASSCGDAGSCLFDPAYRNRRFEEIRGEAECF